MTPVSEEFQTNVNEGRTRLLLAMNGLLIDNSDIASNGLTVTSSLGIESGGYSIGNAASGTISFDLANYDGRFSNVTWGELKAVGYATDGTWTDNPTPVNSLYAICKSDYGQGDDDWIVADAVGGYIYIYDSEGTSLFRLDDCGEALFIYVKGVRVFIFGDNEDRHKILFGYVGDGKWGSCNVSWNEWGTTTWGNTSGLYGRLLNADYQNAMLLEKMTNWWSEIVTESEFNMCGRYESDTQMIDYTRNEDDDTYWTRTWEGVGIGVYDIDRPTSTNSEIISCKGYDAMARLDNIEMDDYTSLFPIGSRDLLSRICADAKIPKNFTPQQNIQMTTNYWVGYTARDFVKDCAGIDASNAMIRRDGDINFRYPQNTGMTYGDADCISLSLEEYITPAITGVSIKNSDSDVGANAGTSSEVLTILENPMAGGLNTSTKERLAGWILSNVDDVTAYHPYEANMWLGWHHAIGDKIAIVHDSVAYSVPIFEIEFNIAKSCKAKISATGDEHRNDMMETNREQYVANFKRYELSKTVDGLLSAVYDENGHSRIEQTAGLISACVTKSGGSASSFGWELTSSSWSLKANGSEVMKVDSAGMKLNGEITCTSLIVGGQTFTPATVQTAIDQASSNYGTWNGTSGTVSSSSGYWNSGGGFANNCWGNSYAVKTVDARYLRMYSSAGYTYICTINQVTIGTKTYWIPCVTPD